MKLTTVLILIASLQVTAKGHTQENITLSEKNTGLIEIFKKIERQTDYFFVYRTERLSQAKKVSIEIKNATLREVLETVLKDQPLTYEIVDKTIVIKPKEKSPNVETTNVIPPIDVSGKVTDRDGNSLVAASVIIKRTGKGTQTDANGMFVLKDVNADDEIEISYTGYKTQTLKVGSNTRFILVLEISDSKLDEIQIKGYYNTTKRLNTGNVSAIKSEDIAKQPISNPLQAVQGRVAGLFITQRVGIPGGTINVQIRGQNSIDKGNNPLYVIDGMPYPSENLLRLYNGNPLNSINPLNIESIDILKDADATAIYGSRGANGVILITTKTGKAGKIKVDASIYYGIAKQTKKVSLLNTEQYLKMRSEAFQNDNRTPGPGDVDVNGKWDATAYTDWQKLLTEGTGRFTDAQISISGGSEIIQYNMGVSSHKETTVFPSDFRDQRTTASISITGNSPNKRLGFQLFTNYALADNQIPTRDLSSFITTAPNAPAIYNSDGTLNWANSTWTNPYSFLFVKYNGRTNNLISNLKFSYRLFSGLQIKANFGFNRIEMNEKTAQPIKSKDPALPNSSIGSAEFANRNIQSWIIEPQINYERPVAKGRLNVFVGTAIQKNQSEGEYIQASGYNKDELLGTLTGAATIIGSALNTYQYKYNALFSGINYNWQNKYLINLSARRDGSSRFGPENRFQNFGAVGIGWVFSGEKFIQNNLPFISHGKLRGSYGSTGNDQIGDYTYLDLYFNTLYSYQNTIGLYPGRLFNPFLEWELTKKLEGGLEIGFLKDKILFTASYFRNQSGNQVLNYGLPFITGFSSIQANLDALVQNTGWEFTLSTNFRLNDFDWKTNINLTIGKNELLEFTNLQNTTYKNRFVINKSLNIVKAYQFLRVDPTTGVYQYKDKSGNPTISPVAGQDDLAVINLDPKFYGGFQNIFAYKGFQLDIFFQFVKQTGYNSLFSASPSGFKGQNIPEYVYNNRWQKPGDQTLFQKFTQLSTSDAYKAYNYIRQSDYGFTDGSYIRLKNLSVSYLFPTSVIQKCALQNLRLFIQGQNLLTITPYKGKDPENQNTLLTTPMRVITGGIQITL